MCEREAIECNGGAKDWIGIFGDLVMDIDTSLDIIRNFNYIEMLRILRLNVATQNISG